MIFNAAGYLAFVNKKAEDYMVGLINDLNTKHPDWIKDIKTDLVNEDGTPKELTEDQIKVKIEEVVNKGIGVYEAKEEDLLKLFTITEEQVKQFIIEK